MDLMNITTSLIAGSMCGIIAANNCFHKEFSRTTGGRYNGLILDAEIDKERLGFSVTIKFDTHLIG